MVKLNKNESRINWETVKTVIIAILVTGIIAFVAGMQYKQAQIVHEHEVVKSAVESMSKTQ